MSGNKFWLRVKEFLKFLDGLYGELIEMTLKLTIGLFCLIPLMMMIYLIFYAIGLI